MEPIILHMRPWWHPAVLRVWLRWFRRPRFACDADLTVYWPEVRPCWEDQ